MLLANIGLKGEEIKVIQQKHWIQISLLVFLSLGTFMMLEVEIVFGFALAWPLGTFIGAIFMLELGWFVKKMMYARLH